MDRVTLVGLMDEDREMVLANIARDRELSAVQQALEKEIDRVLYRYVEGCADPAQRESAQHILQAMKNTLPVIDAVGEARTWKKQADAPRRGPRVTALSAALLAAGLVLVLASVLGVLIAGRGDALAFVKALLPVVGGCTCLALGGAKSVARQREKPLDEATARTEFLADGEKAWHCLRGAMVQADGQLERIREARAVQRLQAVEAEAQGPLDPAALELFAELLEAAYASREDGAKEAADAIRFYLHNARVDVVDYDRGRENWFEFLPASQPSTIRPALVSDGKLVKKGMASGDLGIRH